MYKAAFGFGPPSFDDPEALLRTRYDIAHRNSQTRDGHAVVILPADVEALVAFVLAALRPWPPSDVDGVLWDPRPPLALVALGHGGGAVRT